MAANGVSAAFGFLFWTAAARLYHPQEVGLAAAAVSAVGLLSMVSLLGLDYAVVRFLPHAADPQGVINSVVTIGAAVALGLSLTFVAGLAVWSPALLPLRQNTLLAASLIIATVCTTVTGLVAGVFLARKLSRFVFAQSIVFGATKVILVVIFATIAHTVGLISAWALGLAAAVACALVFFLPWAEGGAYRLRPLIRRQVISDMSRFALTNYAATVLLVAPALLLPLLVVNVVGPESTAYYYVASSVSGLLTMIPGAVSMSLFAHGSHDDGQLVQHTRESIKVILTLLVPAIAAVFLLGDKVLLLFGRSYSEQGTRLLWVLAVSTLPLTVNVLFFSVSRVRQRMEAVIGCTAWILAVTLTLSVVLLPRLGLLGAGVAWFAAQASVAVVILTYYALSR